MMKRAGRVHGLQDARIWSCWSALITWAGIEGYGTLRASALVESLQKVGTPDVPAIVKQLSSYRRWADPRLSACGTRVPMIKSGAAPRQPRPSSRRCHPG